MKKLLGFALLGAVGYYLWKNHFARLFQPKDQVKEVLEEVRLKNEIGNDKRAVFLANQVPTSTIGDTPYAGVPLTAMCSPQLMEAKGLTLLPKGGTSAPNPFDRVLSWLNVIALLLTVQVAGAAVPLGTASTNSFSTVNGVIYSKASKMGHIVYWDDFDGPTMKVDAFLRRRSPSGHQYYLHAVAPAGTNGFLMQGGVIKQTNTTAAAWYLGVTNDTDIATSQPWNWFGMRVKPIGNAGGGFGQLGFIRSSDHTLSGTFLHGGINFDQAYVQRQLTENVFAEYCASAMNRSNWWNIDCIVVSNTVITSVAGEVFIGTHTNLQSFGLGPMVIYEINQAFTDNWTWEIDATYAGYADPEIVALADMSRGRSLGTNGIELFNITRPTLVTNTYLSRPVDTVVAMPNSAASVGGRTNKLPAVGTSPGKTITIYDEGMTAAGTNVWVMTIDGTTINRGPDRTNVTVNGGSISLISTPFGWNITGRGP